MKSIYAFWQDVVVVEIVRQLSISDLFSYKIQFYCHEDAGDSKFN